MAIRDPQAITPQFNSVGIMSLLQGRLGRRSMNLSQSWKQMIQLHLPPMMVGKGTGTLQRGTNMIFQV